MAKNTPEEETYEVGKEPVGANDPMPTTEPKMTRDEMRARVFNGPESKSKTLYTKFNGVNVELRQPAVEEFMNMQDSSSSEGRNFAVDFLIKYGYIKGTDEKLFDVSDYDVLVKLPMNGSFSELIKICNELMDIKVDDKVKN